MLNFGRICCTHTKFKFSNSCNFIGDVTTGIAQSSYVIYLVCALKKSQSKQKLRNTKQKCRIIFSKIIESSVIKIVSGLTELLLIGMIYLLKRSKGM